ncbi:MAG: M16 family metallopeptidase, partial [Candidatus Saccharicenans sp.]
MVKKAFGLRLLGCGLLFLLSFSFLNSQQRFRKTPPYPDPLPMLNLPAVGSSVLPSGLKIITISDLKNPFYIFQVVVQAGESDSPPGLSGLATITAQMLLRGTLTLSPAEVEENIESLGIDYSIEVRPDYTVFSFTFLEDYLDQALGLIKLFFIEPAFQSQELAAAKREFYYRLLNKNTDPEKAGYDFFLKQIFAHTGYNPGVVEEEQLKNISQKDVASFHQRLLRPNNSTVIIAGKINLETARQKVERSFSRWVPRSVEKIPWPKLANKNFDQICLLDLPVKEVSVIAGNAIVPLSDGDYFPLLVL